MSVTANIKLRKPNFAVKSGYFYTFDDDQDALLQKTDDGNTAFSYPMDTLISNVILSLSYDGVYFWTLELATGVYKIKRWKINNYICKLQGSYDLSFGSSHTITTNDFTVEHYHTFISSTLYGGETTIYIDDYYNVPKVISNSILHLGPNINGDEEEVTVTGVVYRGVTISAPLLYPYAVGNEVNFHKHIWIFNDNNGTDASTGALYKLDSHTGGYITKFPGGAYKAVRASTFYRINSFAAYGLTDMLLYNKGTNTLFVNINEDKKTLFDASTSNETFTGTNGSVPNVSHWTTTTTTSGTPTVQGNKLYLALTTTGVTSVNSVYYVGGDFDVYADCSLNTYDENYNGSGYYQHSLEVLFANEANRYCKVSRGYSTEFGGALYQNFSSITRMGTDTVVSGVAASTITSYGLRVRRAGTSMNFFYRTVVAGVTSSWYSLGSAVMFASDATVVLSTTTSLSTAFSAYVDTLTYTSGSVAYYSAATELPFYGSMVMDNIEADAYTIDPLYGMDIDRNNMYRLHLSGTYSYNLSPLSPFVTSISLSASPAIIAANGLSTTSINALVKDQFLQPITGRRVTFSENGDGSITGGTQINTDGTGFAQTVYQAGVLAQNVIVTAVVQQSN